MATGRGRLSSFELLPTEADGIVAWAASELAARERTQTEIYADFVAKCQALMAEHRGELEFDIPAFSSFNRYSTKLAKMARRAQETQDIVRVLIDKHDPQTSEDLAVLLGESIKAQVFHMVGDMADGLVPKQVKELAEAFKHAQSAQNLSSDRKAKEDAKFRARLSEAVDVAAKAKGLTAETAEQIKAEILGVTK